MKLFASFTGLLREIKLGSVSQKDLDTGFFAFGCVRDHAFNPSNDECNEVARIFSRDPEAGKATHAQIVDALHNAEQNNRVLWAKDIAQHPAIGADFSRPESLRAVFFQLAQRAGVEIVR